MRNIKQKIHANAESICKTCIHRNVCWAIDNQPCVECSQYEPVKRGRWVPQIIAGEKTWHCSECETLGSPQWKRCPVCEAKMDLTEPHSEVDDV